MARPTTGHTARFRPGQVAETEDGRLVSATHARNAAPMADVLHRLAGDLTGPALEIASGTGQHVVTFATALPGLRFTPSDPDAVHRASIAAWIAHAGTDIGDPLAVDAGSDWAADPAVARLGPLKLIVAMNVTHITPWSVTEGIIAGAARTLAADGVLAIYGPFRINGSHVGDGNPLFDRRLRADNPAWGVRDTADIARLAVAVGLTAPRIIEMPANNRTLAIHRAAGT